MGLKRELYNLFADLGDWLREESRQKNKAIILGILCIISPINLIFAVGFIASANRKKK
jgi:hypothetical protein